MAQATGKREKRAAVPIFARRDASKPIDFDRILSLWNTRIRSGFARFP